MFATIRHVRTDGYALVVVTQINITSLRDFESLLSICATDISSLRDYAINPTGKVLSAKPNNI